MTRTPNIRYREGQWFAVPLRTGGYALGIIVRGSYKTKGGLGYFFGPKFDAPPEDEITWRATPADALLISKFGDLGILSGRWPLIPSTRPFSSDEWPIPVFGIVLPFPVGKGYVREYAADDNGELYCMREVMVDAVDVAGLPIDIDRGGGSVEIYLTKQLDEGYHYSPGG